MTPKAFVLRGIKGFLNRSGLRNYPVTVRSGVSAGARWTLFPWSAYWRGNFESPLQDALMNLGDLTGKTCWDLGAHYGIYATGLARRVCPSGQVVAIEPNPISFEKLDLRLPPDRALTKRSGGVAYQLPLSPAWSPFANSTISWTQRSTSCRSTTSLGVCM